MIKKIKGVVLIGHGGVPTDFPRDQFKKFMELHKNRQSGQPSSQEELVLESSLRNWPRSPHNDPYQTGLEILAGQLKSQLNNCMLTTAYNEFCKPTISQAVHDLVAVGIENIVLLTTMITPGGSHAEKEIPEEIDKLKEIYPDINIKYAWPFDLQKVAGMMKDQIEAV